MLYVYDNLVFIPFNLICKKWGTCKKVYAPLPVFIRMGTVSHPIISNRVSIPYLGGPLYLPPYPHPPYPSYQCAKSELHGNAAPAAANNV
jgi:hypothetical protein